MIEIKLDSDIWLTSDEHQYMLSKKRPDGIFANFSFHSSLESALKSYVERFIRLSEAKSIDELRKIHFDLIESLNKLLRPFKIEIRRGEMNERISK
mgnify:CR=1 FL=1